MSNANNTLKGKINTNTIIGLGLLTAIVVVMQFISMGLRFGTFSITLTLIPIVVGSALYGWGSGAWLGFVFGVTVLLTGDANPFLAVNIPGTIITVVLKGTLAGLCAGLGVRGRFQVRRAGKTRAAPLPVGSQRGISARNHHEKQPPGHAPGGCFA